MVKEKPLTSTQSDEAKEKQKKDFLDSIDFLPPPADNTPMLDAPNFSNNPSLDTNKPKTEFASADNKVETGVESKISTEERTIVSPEKAFQLSKSQTTELVQHVDEKIADNYGNKLISAPLDLKQAVHILPQANKSAFANCKNETIKDELKTKISLNDRLLFHNSS